MDFTLKRLDATAFATYDQLIDEEERAVCVCLELPWRNNVHNESRIPAGRYHVFFRLSPKRGYVVPQLENVPDRDDVQMHIGNLPEDTDGCILFGTQFGEVVSKKTGELQHGVVGSSDAFKHFMALTKGEDGFWLTIVDPDPVVAQ